MLYNAIMMRYLEPAADRAYKLSLTAKKIKKSFKNSADRVMKVKSKLDDQVATIESFENKYVRITHPGFPSIVWEFEKKYNQKNFFEVSIYSLIENKYTAVDGY